MKIRLLLLISLAFLVACNVMDFATPEQKAELLALQEATDAAQAALEKKSAELELLDEAVQAQLARIEEVETAAELAVVKEGLTNAVALYEEQRGEHEALMADFKAAAAAEGAKRAEIVESAGQGFGAIGTQLGGPAVGALVVSVAGLAARGLTERGREHIGRALKEAAKLQLRDAGAATLKALGFAHTSDDPDALLAAAATVAAKKGDIEAAGEIRNFAEGRKVA